MLKLLKYWPKRWIATALVVLIIMYLTLVPRPLPDTQLQLIPGIDKVVHAIMFVGLSGVALIDLCRRGKGVFAVPTRRQAISVCAAAIAFGGVIEVAQQAMALGRGGDIADFAADAAGAAAGILASRRILHAAQA